MSNVGASNLERPDAKGRGTAATIFEHHQIIIDFLAVDRIVFNTIPQALKMSLTTITSGTKIASDKKAQKRARDDTAPQSPSKKHKKNSTAAIGRPNGTSEKMKKKKTKHAESAEDLGAIARSNTQIKLEDKHLKKHSAFVQETQSLFIGLAPVAHNFPLEGACAEYLSPLLLTYYPPLDGVVLSYSNPRLSQHAEQEGEQGQLMGKSIDEYGVTYIWLTADFILFRPVAGTVLEGYVNLQNQSVLGLLCYNYFNAAIEQTRLPKDWRWVEEEVGNDDESEYPQSGGHFVDGEGRTIEGRILFEVKDFEASTPEGGGPSNINIYGSLLKAEEDAKVDAEARQQALIS